MGDALMNATEIVSLLSEYSNTLDRLHPPAEEAG